MDPSSIYALSSVAGAVSKSMGGIVSNWIYHKYKKWKLRKRLTGVLLLKGVSTICQKLSNSEVLFFDIDVIYRELTAPKEASDHKEPTVVVCAKYKIINCGIIKTYPNIISRMGYINRPTLTKIKCFPS